MTSPEGHAVQAQLLARVRAARVQRDESLEENTRLLHQAIRAALDAGTPVKDVAAAAGLTRQRIHQIARDGSGQ